MKRPVTPPNPGTTDPRYPGVSREVLEILEIAAVLQRRQWARKARTSTTLRMRGGVSQ